MITIERDQNIFIMKIFAPRKRTDETEFCNFLNDLLDEKDFSLLIKVDGEKNFSHESKVVLNHWFKEHKNFLYEHCNALYRVRDPETFDEKKIIRLKKAFPFHYNEYQDFDEAYDAISNLK